MNEKFFSLPKEKQQAILDAGYRVFSQNSYKKSPMSEIASAAGISKSLLFHYFHNKQELYLFLWENCAQLTIRYLTEYQCYEQTDLFEMLYHGLKAKIRIIHEYPNIGAFVIKAYYEKDPEVGPAIQTIYKKYVNSKSKNSLMRVDPKQFRDGIDLEMMYRDMYYASEGYLLEETRKGPVDADKMEKDFMEMIAFWKEIYLKKEE